MYRHTDKQHIHYHIISSRVDVRSGKAISSSYEGLRTKTVLDQLAPLFGYQVGKGADKRQQQNQGLIREIDQVVQKVLLEDQPYSMYRFCQACEKRGLKVKKLPRGYVISQGNSYPVALSKLPVFAERRLSHILRAVKQEESVKCGISGNACTWFSGICLRLICSPIWRLNCLGTSY